MKLKTCRTRLYYSWVYSRQLSNIYALALRNPSACPPSHVITVQVGSPALIVEEDAFMSAQTESHFGFDGGVRDDG